MRGGKHFCKIINKQRAMNTENIYQVLDDLETFANNIGSEWMKERVAMLEAQIANLENQSTL